MQDKMQDFHLRIVHRLVNLSIQACFIFGHLSITAEEALPVDRQICQVAVHLHRLGHLNADIEASWALPNAHFFAARLDRPAHASTFATP